MSERIAVIGGLYSNHLALRTALEDIQSRGIKNVYCLGDLGAFGPNPDKVFPLLQNAGVRTIQGNYDNSIGNRLEDCQCGYTDPRDNHFARISYQYTYGKTSEPYKDWMKDLDASLPVKLGNKRILMCHGSPRTMNEFLWESTTPTHFLEKLCDDYEADVILATHTGIHWRRSLSRGREFVNVGVLGRPENDGTARVWYTILKANATVEVEFVPMEYDHEALAEEMRGEGLPEEFIETTMTGYWTTCLEILPSKERQRGEF